MSMGDSVGTDSPSSSILQQSEGEREHPPMVPELKQGLVRTEIKKDTYSAGKAQSPEATLKQKDDHKRCASQSPSPVSDRLILPLRHKRSRLTPVPPSTVATPLHARNTPTTTSSKSTRAPFNLFTSILKHPELVLALASALPIPDLLSLYAISKPFHYLLNSHHTTYILASARRWAPDAVAIFPFNAYAPLCIVDPVRRANPERPAETRLVPGFRWLQMAHYRTRAVSQIVALLALDGHRLPARAKTTLKKLWFLMDVSTNGARIGLVHNRAYWTDEDLEVATLFFMKLDMRFMDPVDGVGETGMRRLLLGQRSLTTLWRVLGREALTTQLELLQMYVRYSYRPKNPAHGGMSILGVPAAEVGKGCLEGWGRGSVKLLTPDELVMREAVRRDLRLHEKYLEYMLFGYLREDTLDDIPLPTVEGILAGKKDDEQGAQSDDDEEHDSEDS